MALKIEVKGPIVSNDTARLYHYFGWDACAPKDITTKLEEAAGDDVILEINSPGGICSYGYEMYTALMEYEGKVIAHVITAASAASLLVCAADEALASDTCIFMIHNTKSSVNGDYREMQNCADMLREYNEGIINAYVRKTGKSREELQIMMDNETYMSPKTAIENGFIDGYMFGNPEEEERNKNTHSNNTMLLQVMNAAVPVIEEERAKEIIAVLNMPHNELVIEDVGIRHQNAVTESDMPEKVQNGSRDTAPEIDVTANNFKKGEKRNMKLQEVYAEHPEVEEEVSALISVASDEGAAAERQRLKDLDAIAASVTSEALISAKYGENRMDAKELAYQSLVDDGKKAKNYMKNAVNDSKVSGVDEVGAGIPEEDTKNETDDMASHVNEKKKGGK